MFENTFTKKFESIIKLLSEAALKIAKTVAKNGSKYNQIRVLKQTKRRPSQS